MPAQVRMVNQAQARPVAQPTITRHTTPARLQGPQMQQHQLQQQRMMNANIRPVVQNNIHHQMNPPALQPVGGVGQTFTSGNVGVSVIIH